MREHGVRELVFSSSATVYGGGATPAGGYDESAGVGVGILSPYGQTKYMAEVILRDACAAEPALRVAILRYFNPVGAHPSGSIGEDPRGIPNNLVPVIQRVAVGKLPRLTVFGSDYATPDGTAQRDYIHVVDLAEGHVAALAWLAALPAAGAGAGAGAPAPAPGANVGIFNLGTGTKSSVLEVVAAFERACGAKIPVEMAPRRAGDAAAVWANTDKAARVLGWRAKRDLACMVEDSWRWASKNPDGYDTK
jgi:UDP-glucose 4-epimerase